MSATSITLLVTLIGSPVLVPAYEYSRNKIWAKASFHGWQAVFIHEPTGTTTYFGHITSVSKTDITLRDIYYLKDPEVSDSTPEAISKLLSPQLKKLGEEELHQPEDKMIINRQFIAFMENLTNDAPIVKAILKHSRKDKGQ